MIIKKIIVGFFLLSFLNGCAQNTVLLGPAYTFGTTGSVYHAGLTFGSNKAISNFTGRSVGENIKEIFEPKDENAELYLPFLLKEAINIFRDDKNEKYISEKNQDFLNETGAVKNFNYNDAFLRPPLVSKCIYDFMTGSTGSKTPLRYNLNYRNFYYVTSGKINIKLIPPHSSKYLYPLKDYDNFEFRSPVNVWDVQQEYKADFDKVKVLDVTLEKGEIIYIPAYWWYSIEYEKISSVCAFKSLDDVC